MSVGAKVNLNFSPSPSALELKSNSGHSTKKPEEATQALVYSAEMTPARASEIASDENIHDKIQDGIKLNTWAITP